MKVSVLGIEAGVYGTEEKRYHAGTMGFVQFPRRILSFLRNPSNAELGFLIFFMRRTSPNESSKGVKQVC